MSIQYTKLKDRDSSNSNSEESSIKKIKVRAMRRQKKEEKITQKIDEEALMRREMAFLTFSLSRKNFISFKSI